MVTTTQPSAPVGEKHLPKSILSRDSIQIRRIAVPVDLTSPAEKRVDTPFIWQGGSGPTSGSRLQRAVFA
jgi:hypothetical protein